MSRGGFCQHFNAIQDQEAWAAPLVGFPPLCSRETDAPLTPSFAISFLSPCVLFWTSTHHSGSFTLVHTPSFSFDLSTSTFRASGLDGAVWNQEKKKVCLCHVCATINITSDFQRICQDKQLRACQCYTTIPLGHYNMHDYISVSRDVYLGRTIWSIHHSLTIKLLEKTLMFTSCATMVYLATSRP